MHRAEMPKQRIRKEGILVVRMERVGGGGVQPN